jgi:hypothetical protein
MDTSIEAIASFLEAIRLSFREVDREVTRRFRPYTVRFLRSYDQSKAAFEVWMGAAVEKCAVAECAIEVDWIDGRCMVTPIVRGLGPDDHAAEPMARLIQLEGRVCPNFEDLLAAIESATQSLLDSMDQVMAQTEGWFPLRARGPS